MKRNVPFIVAVVLALSLVLAAFGPVSAGTTWADPTVTPLSGDGVFTITVVDPSKLPGSYKGTDGLTLPTGFVEGEKQFGGKGLIIKGLDAGTATACFPFPTYRYGWRGSISQWNGTKWVKLATTVTEGKEGAAALACTKIYGNGSYALIISFDPNEVDNSCGTNILNVMMDFGNTNISSAIIGEPIYIYAAVINPALPIGSNVTYSIQGLTPPGALGGDLTAVGEVVDTHANMSLVIFPEGTVVYYNPELMEDLDFTLKVTTSQCSKNFSFPEFLDNLSPTD